MHKRLLIQFFSVFVLLASALGAALPAVVQAQSSTYYTCSSKADGDWDQTSTWNCYDQYGNLQPYMVPNGATNVTVSHSVTIGSRYAGQGYFAEAGALNVYGTLNLVGSLIVWGPETWGSGVSISSSLYGNFPGAGIISFDRRYTENNATRHIYSSSQSAGYAPKIGLNDQYWYSYGNLNYYISGNFYSILATSGLA